LRAGVVKDRGNFKTNSSASIGTHNKMRIKKLHYVSGLTIAFFVTLHLINHVCSVIGVKAHIEFMEMLRHFYRNIFVEIILLLALLVQIISGLKLFFVNRKVATTRFEKLHIWSGLYLAFFFMLHVNAVFVGRFYLHLDTNFYFGAAGINTFPVNLFFVPYYTLAIMAFFGHIASVHHKKMTREVFGVSSHMQAKAILIFGACVTLLIFFGVTDHFRGIQIPVEYNVLVGK
jgi:hypothetical protein